MNKVPASIPVLLWAARRARLGDDALAARFPKWPLWSRGEAQPTLKQLEDFAHFTHTPIGFFFLPQPPQVELPVPDLRTMRDAIPAEPSTDLLDTIYLCQQRQDWYRDHARWSGIAAVPFIGSAQVATSPVPAAAQLRDALGVSVAERRHAPTWSDALRQLIAKAEEAGVLVMVSSVVGGNAHRKLDVGEFRGFVLADDLAPLIFINGADSKAAQMFTLAHEMAHLSLGVSGVSDVQAGRVPHQRVERWCNAVAAELLVPMSELRAIHRADAPLAQEIQRLAREFKVSTLVVLRRLFDAGVLTEAELWQRYRDEVERLRGLSEHGPGGGDFYRSLGARVSKRFARALVGSTLEGLTSFPDALRMLGMRKTATFHAAARELGVTA